MWQRERFRFRFSLHQFKMNKKINQLDKEAQDCQFLKVI